jgi:hypothetical protein
LVKDADLVLLDEPLANLDYKLREELREELPRVFENSGAVFVYATTEPSEALLLGGNTACLRMGEIVQFGRTIDIYNRPSSLYAAEVFSDPPINRIAITLAGGKVTFPCGDTRPARGQLTQLADGRYTLAFRAHQLTFGDNTDQSYPFCGKVLLSEITGSESYVHVVWAGTQWVSVAPGVHNLLPGMTLVVPSTRGKPLYSMKRGVLPQLLHQRRGEADGTDRSGRHWAFLCRFRCAGGLARGQAHVPHMETGWRLRLARTVGLWEDDAAQHHFRHRRSVARTDSVQ